MTQSSYPFEYSVLGTWTPEPKTDACKCGFPEESLIHGEDGDHDMEDNESFEPDGNANVVYLVEGRQLGYGTKVAWEEATR